MASSSFNISDDVMQSTSIWIAPDASPISTYESEVSEVELQKNFVYNYFNKKKIKDLFHFMVQHLIINEPDNPIEYLKDLADKLLLWRSGTVKKAPHIFEERHVEAIYDAFDPAKQDSISLDQYHQGFKTLMLTDYDIFPMLADDHMSVKRDIFKQNMLLALDNHLMSLILPPYHNLCEFTILPDESYNVLFQDVPKKKGKPIPRTQALPKQAVKKESTDSCDSQVSCVKLKPPNREEEENESNNSEFIPASEYETISEYDLGDVDFLITRRGTLISKITLVAGKIGEKTKELITKKTSTTPPQSADWTV